MATRHVHRLLAVTTAARCAAVNARVRQRLDPSGSDWFTPSLSATGEAPATHAWACFALTDEDAKDLLYWITEQANIPRPSDATWDGWSGAERRQWVRSVRNTVRTRLGVWLVPMDNLGRWDEPQEVLDFLGLKVITQERS